jgi:hypothetical protein
LKMQRKSAATISPTRDRKSFVVVIVEALDRSSREQEELFS